MNVTKVSSAAVAAKPAAADNAAAAAATDASHVDAPAGESLVDQASNKLAQIGEGLGILLGTRKQAAPPVPQAAGTFSYNTPAPAAGKLGATALSNIPPAALAEVRGRADAALLVSTDPMSFARAQPTLENLVRQLSAP